LIKWENMPVEQGTWEDAAFIQRVFPGFQPWRQDCCRSGELSCPRRYFKRSPSSRRSPPSSATWTGPIVLYSWSSTSQ
jgi:hypothetical protein